MADWSQDMVVLTPLSAAAEARNASLTGQALDLVHLAATAGWTMILALLAVRTLLWE